MCLRPGRFLSQVSWGCTAAAAYYVADGMLSERGQDVVAGLVVLSKAIYGVQVAGCADSLPTGKTCFVVVIRWKVGILLHVSMFMYPSAVSVGRKTDARGGMRRC
jgi:hypothetical protein